MVIFESCVRVGCGAHPAIIQWLPGFLFPGVKQPEREADRTISSSFMVKNRWSFALPLRFYVVKLSDFTLYLHFRITNKLTNAFTFGSLQGSEGVIFLKTYMFTKWQKYSQNITIFISYERVDHITVYNYMFRPLSAIVRLYYFVL